MAKASDPRAALRSNVRLLGDLLGQTLKEQEGEALYDTIEQIRQLSKEATQNKDASRALCTLLRSLTPSQMVGVVRAFSHFLNLANIAESVQRIRRTKWYQLHQPTVPQKGSILAVVDSLKQKGVPSSKILECIQSLSIDLVLTAHPTEVTRRTIMQKFDRIANYLLPFDEKWMTLSEVKAQHGSIFREINAIWKTDEIRRRKPTPIDEARWGFAIVESSLWQALPDVLRALDETLKEHIGEALPISVSPFRFSSWMGGDRDGNPNVTAVVTEKICLMARWAAAELYGKEVSKLTASLSMRDCDPVLREHVKEASEPYRAILRPLKQLLLNTKKWLQACLQGNTRPKEAVIESQSQILAPLMLCYNSLMAMNLACIATGDLTDLIRRVNAFGIGLGRLDIRQEAIRHTQLITEITVYCGLGEYANWDEAQRIDFLEKQLQSESSLIPSDMQFSEDTKEVWNTFLMIARQLPESLGAYVISMASAPSDVLLVCLLQQEAKVQSFLRVVPLFEKRQDLQNAHVCLEALLECDWYRRFILGQQEIMIGYSDSGKDVGIVAASWAQYLAQEKCVEIAKKRGVKLTLFHGRGGSVGRGGAPTHKAILSQPPGSVGGSLRVTEQGEVLRHKYNLPARAFRSLEIYLTATLEATLLDPPTPKAHWRETMDALATQCATTYSGIVKEDPAFMAYFHQATPIDELGALAIGSRPPRRNSLPEFASLRAIPWVFAWTQNRLLLSAWLGAGEAFATIGKDKQAVLVEMASMWPYFRSLLEMLEMVLAKASLSISQHYEKNLVSRELFDVGEQLREKFRHTAEFLASLLKEANIPPAPLLRETIELREPYLVPLHMLQAELLYRVRHNDFLEQEHDALLVSISGIAAGMQNTG